MPRPLLPTDSTPPPVTPPPSPPSALYPLPRDGDEPSRIPVLKP
ncbi:MAG: hypothetical protein R2857_04785 [Vampirovibrionales bacterium]